MASLASIRRIETILRLRLPCISPDFGDGFFGRLLGRNGKSVIRGGFRVTYNRIGVSRLHDVGVVRFLFDNLAAGESKTAKIVYQRF